MAGGFVFVVGPSGAGKDSLIAFARTALAGNQAFVFPQRIVTRPSSEFEQNETLDEEAFAAAEASGAFAVSWRAHGLGYAYPEPASTTSERGCIVILNISRRVVPWSRIHLPNVAVVEVTAPVEILAARLAGRARLEDGDLAARLARSLEVWTPVDASIVNDGAIEDAGRELVAFITGHAATCRADARRRGAASFRDSAEESSGMSIVRLIEQLEEIYGQTGETSTAKVAEPHHCRTTAPLSRSRRLRRLRPRDRKVSIARRAAISAASSAFTTSTR